MAVGSCRRAATAKARKKRIAHAHTLTDVQGPLVAPGPYLAIPVCRRPVFSVPVSGMVSYSAAAGDRNGGMIHCPSHYHGLIITTNSTRVCLASFVTFIIQWNSSNPDTDREKKVRCLHFRGKIACKNCYCKCLSILSGVSLEMEE